MIRVRNNEEYDRVRSEDDSDDDEEPPEELVRGRPYNDRSALDDNDDNDNDNHYDASENAARGGGGEARLSSSSTSSSSSNSILDDDVDDSSRSRHRRSRSKNRSSRRRVAPPRRRGGHHDHHCSAGRFVVGAASVAAAVTLSWTWAWAYVYATLHLQNTDNDNIATSASPAPPNNGSTPDLGNNNMNLNSDNELIDNPRPPHHELISDFQTQVTGNVSWLLDFAILGHAKCATTSHLNWLRTHPDIYMPRHEVSSLRRGHPAELVSLLYALPNRPHKKWGYKNPLDIMDPRALDLIRVHWPNAKIVVGVRHPIRWFESYYNYNKRQNSLGIPGAARLGPAENMSIPRHVYYHRHLRLLGKTNGSDPHERALVGGDGVDDSASEPPPTPVMTNKVFLYESTQPFEVRDGRSALYRDDLAAFLELTSPLSPIHMHGPTDGTTYYNYTSHDYHYAMDVCDDTYKPLRRQLLDVGNVASEWILRYFVGHPDVTVSSPDRFEELLKGWSIDPCEKEEDDATRGM